MVVMLVGGPLLAGLLWLGREVNWATACLALISACGGGILGGLIARSFFGQLE
jgi:hypothetical protein